MRQCNQCRKMIGSLMSSEVVIRPREASDTLLFCDYICEQDWDMAHPSRRTKWLLLAGVVILLGVAFKAWGAPDPDSPLPYKDWFESVHNREGTWCCTVADGHMTDYSYDGTNYKVKIEGQFYLIPWNSSILSVRHDKPFIGGVIWWYKNSDGSIAIRCFVADDST